MAVEEVDIRTYGGWRKARGIGLFGLGPVATAVVIGSIMVGLILATEAPGVQWRAGCPGRGSCRVGLVARL